MKYFVFLVFLTYFHSISASLDFKELDDINYGIEILDTPVLLPDDPSSNGVQMTSMYGQQYQCSYQERTDEIKKEKEEEKHAEEIGIVELLKPMKTKPCLIHSKGWWSYEFCYGVEIKQYHLEDNKISGQVINMGNFDSDFTWDERSAAITKKQRVKYHSQQYVNGSSCDLTGKHRRTEVRFMCDQTAISGDIITRIDEPETCVYTLTINTVKLCNHPVFKPPTPNKPITISCSPVLGEADYDFYLDQKEEELLAEKARLEEELANAKQQEYEIVDGDEASTRKLPKGSTVDGVDPGMAQDPLHPGHVDETDHTQDMALNTLKGLDQQIKDAAEAIQSAVQKSLNNGMRELFGDDANDGDVQMEFKVLDDSSDLKKAIQEMMKTKTKKAKAIEEEETEEEETADEDKTTTKFISQVTESITDTKSPPEDEYVGHEATVEELFEDDEDEEHVDQFNKELDEILDEDEKAHMHKYKDNIKHSVSAQFQDIVEEAKRELNIEDDPLGDNGDNKLVQQLSKTLNTLLKQLDKVEKEYDAADQYVKEGEAQHVDEADDLDLDEIDDINIDEGEGTKQDEKDKESSTKQNVKFQKFTKVPGNEIKQKQKPGDGSLTKTFKGQDTEVRMSQGSEKVKARVREMSQSQLQVSDEKDKSLGGLKADDQKKQIEENVKNQLQKTGVDTGGRNVEVRIITAGYYDDEDGQLHILPEDENNAFSKMFIAILGQNDEEVKENQRQRKLEKGYSFKFDKAKDTEEVLDEE